MSPKVSAIVLSYNHERFIFQALEAVFLQDYNDYEIIIRDDASTDLTPDIIQNFINTYKPLSENITVEYIKGRENMGLIGSYNDALKKSKGKIIVVFAGDDISYVNRIGKTVDLLEKYGVNIIAVDSKVINENGEVISESFYNRKGIDRFAGIGEKIKDYRLINSINFPLRLFSIGGYGFTFGRSLLSHYNGLIPDVHYEDDFLVFLAMWGKGILFSYEPLVYYRIHTANISHSELSGKSNLKQLLNYKLNECALYEMKINHLNDLDKQKTSPANRKYILRIEKELLLNKIQINYLQGKGICSSLSLLIRLLFNEEIKIKTKFRYLFYYCNKNYIKRNLETELKSRLEYYSFDNG